MADEDKVTIDVRYGRFSAAALFQIILQKYNKDHPHLPPIHALFLGAIALEAWYKYELNTCPERPKELDLGDLFLPIPISAATLDILLYIPGVGKVVAEQRIAEATAFIKKESQQHLARRKSIPNVDVNAFYGPLPCAKGAAAFSLFIDTEPPNFRPEQAIPTWTTHPPFMRHQHTFNIAEPALLMVRLLERIRHETILDLVENHATSIHAERRNEQVRMLRLCVNLYHWKAAKDHLSKPSQLSTGLLIRALQRPDELIAYADHFRGKSMLTSALALEQARWQAHIEEGRKRKREDFIQVKTRELEKKNLKAFKLIRNWLDHSAFHVDHPNHLWVPLADEDTHTDSESDSSSSRDSSDYDDHNMSGGRSGHTPATVSAYSPVARHL